MTRPVSPPPPIVHDNSEHHDHPAEFWQRRWVQKVLPLGSSLAFHLVIIVIGLLTYKAVQHVVSVQTPQAVIPEGNVVTDNLFAGIPHPEQNHDSYSEISQNEQPEIPDPGKSVSVSNKIAEEMMAGAKGDTAASAITIGAGEDMGHPNAHSLGSGPGDGGKLARFGPGDVGEGGPKSIIKGIESGGRHIMFLCDASGSMLGVFGQLKAELHNSINKLKPIQSFNVVFFSDDGYQALSKSGMILATPDNLRKANDFIDNAVASGGTQPLPAIKFALGEHADLVWLLTDGFDQVSNFDDVLNAFRSNNADRRTINCIFLQSDEDPKLVEVLKTIADENHGIMKTIRKSDF